MTRSIDDNITSPKWEAARLAWRHVVRIGLDYPRRAFTVYLRPKRQSEHVTLSFTLDDLLILGFRSTPRGGMRGTRNDLEKLMQHYDCFLGMVAAEEAPPVSEEEFRSVGARPHNMYLVGGQRHTGMSTGPGFLGGVLRSCLVRLSAGSGCFRRGRQGCLFARGAGQRGWLRAVR